MPDPEFPRSAPMAPAGFLSRLLSLRVGAMLLRNTAVSCSVFGIGLGVLWVLVGQFALDEVLAAGIAFIIANSLHYLLGRAWIFKGSDRGLKTGYLLFVINSGVGLLVTLALYALLLRVTDLDYLVARIIVSLFAGLIVFALNAILNFRQV